MGPSLEAIARLGESSTGDEDGNVEDDDQDDGGGAVL